MKKLWKKIKGKVCKAKGVVSAASLAVGVTAMNAVDSFATTTTSGVLDSTDLADLTQAIDDATSNYRTIFLMILGVMVIFWGLNAWKW